MNEKELIASLKGTAEADAPSHRAALRRALLSMHQTRGRFAPLRSFITIFSMKKYSIPAVVMAVFVLGFSFNMHAFDPNVAQAQEQVQRAFTRAIQISPEMRAELESQMKADMFETLEEARQAPDLKILTPEEYEKEGQFTISTGAVSNFKYATVGAVESGAVPAPVTASADDVTFTVSSQPMTQAVAGVAVTQPFEAAAGSVVMAGTTKPVKYLSYTDPRGNKTVLGLDKDDTPVFKIQQLSADNITHYEDGSIGVSGSAVLIKNLAQ